MNPVLGPLSVLLLLAVPALATTLSSEDATCPVCEKDFTAITIRSTNSFGGTDLDLCRHANGTEPRRYYVWTCPFCWFSAWGGEFEEGVGEETKKRILAELAPSTEVPEGSSQDAIPPWVKYELAATVAMWNGAKEDEVANLWLNAAWATRNDADDVWEDLERKHPDLYSLLDQIGEKQWERGGDGPAPYPAFRNSLRGIRAGRAAKEDLPEAEPDRSVHLLRAAMFLRWRGEDSEARPLLESIAEGEAVPAPIREQAMLLLASLDREVRYRKIFLEHCDKALKAGLLEGPGLVAFRYIRADTLRRLGRRKAAIDGYLAAMETGEDKPWISELAAWMLDRIGAAEAHSDRIRELKARRREKLVKRLADPETSEDAAEGLADILDPQAAPGIAAALASEDEDVRKRAAGCLTAYDDPGPDAVAALGRMLVEDPRPLAAMKAAEALLAIADPRAKDALEKAIGAEDNRGVTAAEALGLAGDTSSVPALLKARKRWPGTAEVALSQLTNREFESEESFEAWWKAHRAEPRSAWVVDGFARAGLEIKAPGKRESIPLLIEALGDDRYWIRTNALRALRDQTGRRTGWKEILDLDDSDYRVRKRSAAVEEWRKWWAEEGGK
jgi:HEAT repeat protein